MALISLPTYSALAAAVQAVLSQWSGYDLVLDGEGTNGQTNTVFVDQSTNNLTLTSTGTPTQGPQSPFYGETYGVKFDGSAALSVSASANFAFGTGDFTAEAWVYQTSQAQLAQIVGAHTYGASVDWSLFVNASGYPYLYLNDGSSLISATKLALRTWTHVAVVRASGVATLYLNGTSVATGARGQNLGSTVAVTCGSSSNNDARAGLVGTLSNVRVVKGTAMYGSNFTPSTVPLTSVSGTSLLACQSNRFVDNSSNHASVTALGNPKVLSKTPFMLAYDKTLHGGSAYLSSSARLTASASALALGAQDFTLEAWVYPSGATSYNEIFSSRPNSGIAGSGFSVGFDASYRLFMWNGAFFQGSAYLTLDAWNHVALSRTNGTMELYLNGVRTSVKTDAGSYASSTWTLGNNPDGGEPFTGYISAAHIVVGSSKYTGASFVVPTVPTAAMSGTVLLSNFNSMGVVDKSLTSQVQTLGSAQISTTQLKNGSSSMKFNGSTDAIRVSGAPSYQFAGDFTIEFWYYNSNVTAGLNLDIIGNYTSNAANCWVIVMSSGTLQWYPSSAATSVNVSATTNTWTHIACVRQGSTCKMYQNGVAVGTPLTFSGVLGDPSFALNIGARGGSAGFWNGYLDDIKILNGVAKYTSNFTPA